MQDYINALETEFKKNADPKIAQAQKTYMRNQFEYYGIKTPLRREIQKPFLVKAYLPPKAELEELIKILWAKPQRDFHLFAQELLYKYVKQFEKKDVQLFEFMVTYQSWWDTVDFIAPKLVGNYFKMHPETRDLTVKKWLASEDIWLQRTSLLFQLKFKQDLDENFLAYVINALLGSKEFFINKAIGWILREHSKREPSWVRAFVDKTDLHPLSNREALKLLK